MNLKAKCDLLVGRVMDSLNSTDVDKEKVKKYDDIHEAYIDKKKQHDTYEGQDVKGWIQQAWEFGSRAISYVNKNLLRTEFDYLTQNGFASIKQGIKNLKNRISHASTDAQQSIINDLTYDVEVDGKVKRVQLDNDSVMDISMYLQANQQIDMYQRNELGLSEYNGIYFKEEFDELMNDENITGEFKSALETDLRIETGERYERLIKNFKDNFGSEPDEKTQRSYHKEAEEQAKMFVYVENFLKPHAYKLKQKIDKNPHAKQAYNKIKKTREDLNERTRIAMKDAGKDIEQMFVYSPEAYFRAVFRDVKQSMYGTSRGDITNIGEMETKRKGSNKAHNTNFFVSEMAYRTMMETEIAKANFVEELKKSPTYDKTRELQEFITETVDTTMQEFSDKFEFSNLSEADVSIVASHIHSFNTFIGSRYPDLKIEINDPTEKRTWIHKGKEKTGTVFQELNDNIEQAMENERNLIKNLISKGELDEYFERYPQFAYLREGEITERDIVMFSKYFTNGEYQLPNAMKFTKFRHLQQSLRNSVLNVMGVDVKRDILKQTVRGKDGRRRVLVSDLGNSLKGLDATNVMQTLEQIKKDANITDEKTINQMQDDYTEAYNKYRDELIEEFGESRTEDFYEEEAIMLALNEINLQYNPIVGKGLYYADLQNTVAMTKDEITNAFLSEMNSNKVNNQDKRAMAVSNTLLQDIMDGNVRYMDEDVARAISQVQADIRGNTKSKDGKGMKVLKQATGWSKFGLLYSPMKFPKFMANNAIGDFTLALHNRPGVAMKLLNPKTFLEHVKKFYSDSWNEEERYFLENSQGFQMTAYTEMVNQLDNASRGKLSMLEKEIAERGDNKVGIAKGMLYMNKLFKKYTNGVTNLSECREMYLRLGIYKQVLNEIQTTGSVKNYGSTQRKMVEDILREADAQQDQDKKLELQKRASLVFANQSLIMYDDLSKFSNTMSTFGMPFIRYAEGNVRSHFRLMNNLMNDFKENYQTRDVGGLTKTGARLGMNMSIMASLPVTLWNAINMFVFNKDEEDIPEYAKESGYFMVGNTYMTNTDIFSDFAKNLGLQNLRYNIGEGVKDKGIVNGVMNGIVKSMDGGLGGMTKNIFQNATGYVNPIMKAPFELSTAQDFFPDNTAYVGNQYSFGGNLFRKSLGIFGMDRFYEMGKFALDGEQKQYKNLREMMGFKVTGSQMDSYFLARQNAILYGQENLGRDNKVGQGYNLRDTKAKLRYAIYKSIREQDGDMTDKLFARYGEYISEEHPETVQEEVQALKQSLKTYFDVIPASSIPQKEYENYINSLSDEEYDRLSTAYMSQQELLGAYYDFIYG